MGTARLTIRQGEDWVETITYLKDSTPTEVTEPRAMVRRLAHDEEPILDLDDGDGGEITQASPGVLTVQVGHDTTAALPAGFDFLWDMFGTVAGKRVKLVDTSLLDILPSVTHD